MQQCPDPQNQPQDLGAAQGPGQEDLIPPPAPEVAPGPGPGSTVTALGLGHGQDLTLHPIIGTRNIQGGTRTAESSGATTAASGGPTTSGAEGGASSHVDGTSVVAGEAATTTITIAPTGRITSRILKNSNSSSSSSKTIHEDDHTTSRNAQEAPLMVTLATLTDPPLLYPDTHSILLPHHTPPLPNADQSCCWLTKTVKM